MGNLAVGAWWHRERRQEQERLSSSNERASESLPVVSESPEHEVGSFVIDVETGTVRFYAHNSKDTELGCILCGERHNCDREFHTKKCVVPCG